MGNKIPGSLLTTAMAVMPPTDVDTALEMALRLDVPFLPQPPNYNDYEDMHVFVDQSIGSFKQPIVFQSRPNTLPAIINQ